MKTTTSLMDIIQSELIKNGHNEFINNKRLTGFNNDYSFIKKVLKYDEDVENIVNDIFFNGQSLSNPDHDKTFKKTFVNKFLNREIGFQTVEGFSGMLIYTVLINEPFISTVYEKLDSYVTGKTISETTNTSSDTSDNRHLTTTLPQNQVNLNVDNTVLDYGDNNNISRTKNVKNDNSKNDSSSFNIDNLIKSRGLLEEVFNDIDKKCFLQIWCMRC